MQLNVTSEIGKLKSVLVHLPGREIDTMVPPMMAQLLFDDILFGQVAREEHRRFQQLIRFVAEEVFDIQDLLEEVFDDDDVKAAVVRDLAKRTLLPRRLTSWLRAQKASVLAEVLIGGIVSEKPKSKSGDLPAFDLLPVPNYFFMRDPQVVLGHGVIVSGMATPARRREALLSKYDFHYHHTFRDRSARSDGASSSIFWADFMADQAGESHIRRGAPTIEGGDILVARRDLLLVGITERTNRAGGKLLAQSLKESDADVRAIIAVEMPKQRSFMHLDTVFTFTSRHECLIYPPVILPGGDQAAKVTLIDLTKKTLTFAPQKS